MTIGYILWAFGNFVVILVYSSPLWYIVPKKNLASCPVTVYVKFLKFWANLYLSCIHFVLHMATTRDNSLDLMR
jgi:hypothetical protein